ncbi:MAG: APC family permease [Kiritimatiellae bacterium]|nr:APC family permease [Kiritimatiellia bacterium]
MSNDKLDSVAPAERGDYLSPAAAWALAFGSAVGWGAFVMPGTTFLPVAGPLGTLLGIVVGALVMGVIALNYHFLMQRHPDAGGAYAYVKELCNHDHAFLCAWFLVLTYAAIAWANATALALIGRTMFRGVFRCGFHYGFRGAWRDG